MSEHDVLVHLMGAGLCAALWTVGPVSAVVGVTGYYAGVWLRRNSR